MEHFLKIYLMMKSNKNETSEVSKFKFGVQLDEPGGLSLFRDKLFIANTNAHQIVMLDLNSRMTEVVNVRESD
jgi:hypothetical protein